jgi:hypothetical protein
MKKIFLILLFFIFTLNSTLAEEFKTEDNKSIQTNDNNIYINLDLKLEKLYTKISKNDLNYQMTTYKKLRDSIINLQEKYSLLVKKEIIDYLYKKINEKYKKILKEYVLSKNNKKITLENIVCWKSDPIYCDTDNDCICADDSTQYPGCFTGNKSYYEKCEDKSMSCTDHCQWWGQRPVKCINNKCSNRYDLNSK